MRFISSPSELFLEENIDIFRESTLKMAKYGIMSAKKNDIFFKIITTSQINVFCFSFFNYCESVQF